MYIPALVELEPVVKCAVDCAPQLSERCLASYEFCKSPTRVWAWKRERIDTCVDIARVTYSLNYVSLPSLVSERHSFLCCLDICSKNQLWKFENLKTVCNVVYWILSLSMNILDDLLTGCSRCQILKFYQVISNLYIHVYNSYVCILYLRTKLTINHTLFISQGYLVWIVHVPFCSLGVCLLFDWKGSGPLDPLWSTWPSKYITWSLCVTYSHLHSIWLRFGAIHNIFHMTSLLMPFSVYHEIGKNIWQLYCVNTCCVCSGGSRISPRRGRQLPRGGRQHTISPKFSKNCTKLKEFGPPGGARVQNFTM